MKRVLSVASEAVPLIKTGGLADVVGALPAAMAGQGWHMRLLVPGYPAVMARIGRRDMVWAEENFFGGLGEVYLGTVDGIEVMALDAPHLFDRAGGPYSDVHGDYWDNPERFAALSWAAAVIARDGVEGWKPELLIAHDWQAALAPAYLRYWRVDLPTVLTIHNIAFQGRVGTAKMDALRLPHEWFHPDGYEFWGDISMLKAGMMAANAITTVSPRYAEELMRGEFGLGLDGVIRARANAVHGILNGIDQSVWDPAADPAVVPFSASRLAAKGRNRDALLAEFGLDPTLPGPLAVLVSRLTPQKGIDLLPQVIDEFVRLGGGLCVLGSGDGWAEQEMRALAERHPGRVGVRIGYDEGLSHLMMGGGDAILVPSRFEPCGLTQLYGLAYGCLPVVARTGGLADTVIDANPAALAAGAATGVQFDGVHYNALVRAIDRTMALYRDQPTWRTLQTNAMKADFSWQHSGKAYAELYRRLVQAAA